LLVKQIKQNDLHSDNQTCHHHFVVTDSATAWDRQHYNILRKYQRLLLL